MKYLITFTISFILFLITFFIGKANNKHDFLDIVWGLGFIVSAIISFVISSNKSVVTAIMTLLVILWGIRLSLHIGKRNINKKEDFRYIKYRQEYKGKHFDLYFFFKMYVFQFILNVIIGFEVVYSNINGVSKFTTLTLIGIIIWIIGFIFESVGDYQLKVFKKNPANKGKLMNSGLWQYTRHPNYFGEATMWWGLYFIAISNYHSYFLIFSPLVITILVRFISGVPLLEKRYEGKADFEQYKKETSIFFPMPKRKV